MTSRNVCFEQLCSQPLSHCWHEVVRNPSISARCALSTFAVNCAVLAHSSTFFPLRKGCFHKSATVKRPPVRGARPVLVSRWWCATFLSATEPTMPVQGFTERAQWGTLSRFCISPGNPETGITQILVIKPRPTLAEVTSEQAAINTWKTCGRPWRWHPEHLSDSRRLIPGRGRRLSIHAMRPIPSPFPHAVRRIHLPDNLRRTF